MENSGDTDKALTLLEQAVRMGLLGADEVTVASSAAIEASKQDHDGLKAKKAAYRDLMVQLNSVNDFLKQIDLMIAEAEANMERLLSEQASALADAEIAFERMHEAEDLLAGISDGISPDERLRLIELLGANAEYATAEELAIMLQQDMNSSHEIGLNKTEEAERLEEKIRVQQELTEKLRSERDAYEKAQTPEERRVIEDRVIPAADDPYEEQLSEEVTFGSVPMPS